jgi:lipopolysaccharide/colanic/teichoic acid biosynthesis glycosyltransferase
MRDGLSFLDALLKRSFDLSVALVGLVFSSWLILLAWIIASINTRSNGFFCSETCWT